jgi:hypothetical protein
MAAHHGECEGVEGAGLDEGGLGDAALDTLAHLVGRPVREGEREYAIWADASFAYQVRDPGDEHAGLARARSGEDEQRTAGVLDDPLLVGVEVRRRTPRPDPSRRRGHAAGGWARLRPVGGLPLPKRVQPQRSPDKHPIVVFLTPAA